MKEETGYAIRTGEMLEILLNDSKANPSTGVPRRSVPFISPKIVSARFRVRSLLIHVSVKASTLVRLSTMKSTISVVYEFMKIQLVIIPREEDTVKRVRL